MSELYYYEVGRSEKRTISATCKKEKKLDSENSVNLVDALHFLHNVNAFRMIKINTIRKMDKNPK